MNAVQAQNPQGWDKRAWITALIVVAVPLLVAFVMPSLPMFQQVQELDGVDEFVPSDFADELGMYLMMFSLFVGPVILCGIARRRPFLWSLLPAAGLCVIGFIGNLFSGASGKMDFSAGDVDPATLVAVFAVCFANFIRFARSRDWL